MSIHESLKELGPCDYSSIPQDDEGLTKYIKDAVARFQSVVDSVPPPPEDSSPSLKSMSETNIAGVGKDVHTNSKLHSEAAFDEEMRKAWGKPMKLSEKDNPGHFGVYKMAAKDKRGAWFARRSVHEGLGFARWKKGFDSEFSESLQVHGAPGEGNVRGIGGEKKVVTKKLRGVGEMNVYHLSAQFPGPSAPRDFVELLVSSTTHPEDPDAPRQYLLVSRPVKHPDVPERNGFVRGQYESIEFIRELPIRKAKAFSTTSLPATAGTGREDKDDRKDEPSGKDQGKTSADLLEAKSGKITREDAEAVIEAGQVQGDSLPKNESGDGAGKGAVDLPVDDDGELSPNPVEWIMITRSDPGGNVPRFMVERGTPSAIVSDAGKFLDWATQKQMPIEEDEEKEENEPAQVDGPSAERKTAPATEAESHEKAGNESTALQAAPHAVTRTVTAYSSSSSSSGSFVSMDSVPAVTKRGSELSDQVDADKFVHQERELDKKLATKKAKLLESLDDTKSRHTDDKGRIKKAEDKHERKTREAEAWYEKEMAKVHDRRAKDLRKREAKEKKERERAQSSDLKSEVQRLREENERLRAELDELKASKHDSGKELP